MGAELTPFVIVADFRTGSTLLATSLDDAPDVRCWGELFCERDLADNQLAGLDRHGATAAQILARAFAAGDSVRAAGFRVMISHPPASRPRWADLWQRLAEVAGLRVLFLRRVDRLAQYASLLVASQTGVFHPSPEQPAARERPRVHVDGPSFGRWLVETDAQRATCERALRHCPSLALDYEQLTGAWQASVAAVQRFLGTARRELPQRKHKLETRPLSQVIANWDEARAHWERWRARREPA